YWRALTSCHISAPEAPRPSTPTPKATPYGHGLVEVPRNLEAVRPPYAGVAYVEEGLRLRQHGLRLPILVMGGIVGSQVPRFIEHDLTLTASSVDKLRSIHEYAATLGRPATVPLNIDTGTERSRVAW